MLEKMQTNATERPAKPREVAAQLRCSTSSVYRWIKRGELEAVRLGGRGSLRIREGALEAFLLPARSTASSPLRDTSAGTASRARGLEGSLARSAARREAPSETAEAVRR